MEDGFAHPPARDERGLGRDGKESYRRGNYLLKGRRRSKVIKRLRARDGDRCCFGIGCIYQRPLDFDTPSVDLPQGERISIEHRREWYRYRSHALEHLALAHSLCNQRHGLALWGQLAGEGQLHRKVGLIDAWPALTYSDELE